MRSLLSQISRIKRQDLPLITLKKMVILPGMSFNIILEDPYSLKAIEASLYEGRYLFIGFPKEGNTEANLSTLSKEQFYEVGVVAYALQIIKMPDKKVHLFLEGRERASLASLTKKEEGYLQAHIDPLVLNVDMSSHVVALMRNIEPLFEEFSRLKKIKKENSRSLAKIDSPYKMVDMIVPYLDSRYEDKVEKFILDREASLRLRDLAEELRLEIEILTLKDEIEVKVHGNLARNQREYFLNEQIKEIQKRLNKEGEKGGLLDRINLKGFPDEIRERMVKEFKKLESLSQNSPESGTLRSYIDLMLDLPWKERTEDHFSIEKASSILEKSHYGMEEAKENILEYLAVRSLSNYSRQPILCLVGPPGTGKTSIAKSIADSLGRKFVKMALGGVRDEAEIRGHRRTYIGALPGKIIQNMKTAGVVNPVFLLDEIEKMSSDYRGDPASAMLEVLDPEQNKQFVDHYLEVPYDLSEVLFITTANSLDSIPLPLLDRLEVIQIEGYTYYEKCAIAKDFLLPRLLKETGLEGLNIDITEKALLRVVNDYTAESGVRSLYRALTKMLRKVAKEILDNTPEVFEKERWVYPSSYYHITPKGFIPFTDGTLFHKRITEKEVSHYLGESISPSLIKSSQAGLVYGLAWTAYGGKVLAIEALAFSGKGELILTGNLGDVMKESARIAYSLARKMAREEDPSVNLEKDLHVHCPEGAIPKDGPSAGITLTMVMLSALLDLPLRLDTAMTGELSLTGNVLPIGGVREKVLAAYRFNLKHVILPLKNKGDTKKLPKEIKGHLKISFVEHISDVWQIMKEK